MVTDFGAAAGLVGGAAIFRGDELTVVALDRSVSETEQTVAAMGLLNEDERALWRPHGQDGGSST